MSKTKLIMMAFIWMVTTTVISATGKHALAGSWDYKGSDVFTKESRIFKSGGGSFKICISKNSPAGTYWLVEEDSFNPDDWVLPPLTYYGGGFPSGDFNKYGCYVYKNIGGFVDGRDNQAEFKVTKKTRGNATVRAWD